MESSDIRKLSKILQENGEKVLDGSSKLTLSINLLQYLIDCFQLIADQAENKNDFDVGTNSKFQVIQTSNSNNEIFRDLQFLHDFIQKTILLKIITVNYDTIQQPPFEGTADISKFRNLKLLELKKVRAQHITGIKNLRSQLKYVICTKALNQIGDLLSKSGGDNSNPLIWNDLREAIFSYNDLYEIDESLELAPFLQVLDLSYNKITNAQPIDCLPNLKYLNLSFNKLKTIPNFSKYQSRNLQTLLLRNNFIEDLRGLITLDSLRELDVSSNCLVDHLTLSSLPSLATLQWLCVEGNPLSCHPLHRKLTARYLHSNTASVKFVLDGIPLSRSERLQIGMYHTNLLRLSNQFQQDFYNSTAITQSLYNNEPSTSRGVSVNADRFSSSVNLGNISGSPSNLMRVRKNRRVRQAVIADENSDNEEETFKPPTIETINPIEESMEHLETKKQIENLVEQYGSRWLYSQSGSLVQEVLGLEKDPLPLTSSSPYNTDDQSNLLERVQELYCNEEKTSDTTEITSNETKYESATESGTLLEYTTANQSTVTLENVNQEEKEEIVQEEQILESPEDFEISNEIVFIVQIESIKEKDEDMLLLEVSVEDGVIRERNTKNALIKSRWSLSSLLSCELQTPTTIFLTFDTVKRNKQTRKYVMSEEEAKDLNELLDGILTENSSKKINQVAYRCMKCSNVFVKRASHRSMLRKPECPFCEGNTVVIELDEEEVKQDRDETPEKGEIALPTSPSHSSIVRDSEWNDTGKVRAEDQCGDVKEASSALSIRSNQCSATSMLPSHNSANSLESSSSHTSVVENRNQTNPDSNIEVISNPSQESIEVLSRSNVNRKYSREEFNSDASNYVQPVTTSLTSIIPNVATTLLAGLTESSSSDSLTDSVCTAYENKTANIIIETQSQEAHMETESQDPKAAEPVGMLSYMFEGFFQTAGKIMNSSPLKSQPQLEPASVIINPVEFSYEDFTQVDHRIKVHLYVNIFEDESEELVWLLRTEILPNNLEHTFSGCVVLSTQKMYILKILNGPNCGDEPQEWLIKFESYTIDNIQAIFTLPWKRGVGIKVRQVSLLSAVTSVYNLCFLPDILCTSNFFAFLTSEPLPDTCELLTSNSESFNVCVQDLILSSITSSEVKEDMTSPRMLSIYSKCSIQITQASEETKTISNKDMGTLIITATDLILVNDTLGWIRPDSVLNGGALPPTACRAQALSNLIELEQDGIDLIFSFLDDKIDLEELWNISLSSSRSIKEIVNAIKSPWEAIFSVPLQVTNKKNIQPSLNNNNSS